MRRLSGTHERIATCGIDWRVGAEPQFGAIQRSAPACRQVNRQHTGWPGRVSPDAYAPERATAAIPCEQLDHPATDPILAQSSPQNRDDDLA